MPEAYVTAGELCATIGTSERVLRADLDGPSPVT